jgi:hypothetical protein
VWFGVKSSILFCESKWNIKIAYEHGDNMQLTCMIRTLEVKQVLQIPVTGILQVSSAI